MIIITYILQERTMNINQQIMNVVINLTPDKFLSLASLQWRTVIPLYMWKGCAAQKGSKGIYLGRYLGKSHVIMPSSCAVTCSLWPCKTALYISPFYHHIYTSRGVFTYSHYRIWVKNKMKWCALKVKGIKERSIRACEHSNRLMYKRDPILGQN